MKSSKGKTGSSTVFDLYPVLSEPGVCRPDEKGRVLFDPSLIRSILTTPKMSSKDIWQYAKRIAVPFFNAAMANENLKDIPRSTLINHHIDVAETILLHHSKKLMWTYKSYVEELENDRGYYLAQQTKTDEKDTINLKEYAFWLVGRVEKMRADPVKSLDTAAIGSFITDIEMLLRHAEAAGHMDATDALATFLYTEKEQEDEAIALWEKAAASGYAMAIQNLSSVLMGDQTLTAEKKMHSLISVWEGVARNREETLDVVETLAQAGYMSALEVPSPA
jgi:hypothetical protein